MSAINFGRPKRTSSNDSVRKLEESMESDDNHSLSGREERVLGLGLEPELDTTPTNEVSWLSFFVAKPVSLFTICA